MGCGASIPSCPDRLDLPVGPASWRCATVISRKRGQAEIKLRLRIDARSETIEVEMLEASHSAPRRDVTENGLASIHLQLPRVLELRINGQTVEAAATRRLWHG